MSTRERCNQLLDMMPESQLELVLAYIQGLTAQAESADDAYCEALYQRYLSDPDKGEFVSEEDVAKKFGIAIR